MNFVPDDPKKEDGARKIWTGKLLEWDMQSNVAYYHHLNKSKVDDRSYINLNPSTANNAAKSKSVNAVGSKQTNTVASFLGDIWDAITVFFSDIATALNIPGYYPYTSGGAAVIAPCDFLWGLFCGGGGGGGVSGSSSTTDDEGNSYNFVYSGFVDGYNGYDASQGVNWSLYLSGSGGGDSDPCIPQAVKGKTVQQLPGGCSPDGTVYVITPAMVINAAAVKYQLTSDQQDWLNYNKGYFYALSDYVNNNTGLLYNYYQAVNFLNDAIDYLMNSPASSVATFMSQYTGNSGPLSTFVSPDGNLPVVLADDNNLYGEPIDYHDPSATYYSYADGLTVLNNLHNEATGDPIELYLVAKYRGSALLDLSQYSIGGTNYHVGTYYLTPHFDKNGTLLFYAAWRNPNNGIEYLIPPAAMPQFIIHYKFYLAAANVFYLQGPPSPGILKLIAGDYVGGLKDLWGQALTDPIYLTNLAAAFVIGAVPAEQIQFISYENVTTGNSIPNFSVGMTLDDFKANLSTNTGSTWQPTSTPGVEILTKGNFTWTSRTAPNSNSGPTIDVKYNGVLQAKYRTQ